MNDYMTDSAKGQVGTGIRKKTIGKQKDYRDRVDAAHAIRTTLNVKKIRDQAESEGFGGARTLIEDALEELWNFTSHTTQQWQIANLGPDKVIDEVQTELKIKWLRSDPQVLDPAVLLRELVGETAVRLQRKLDEVSKSDVDDKKIKLELYDEAINAVKEVDDRQKSIVDNIEKDLEGFDKDLGA